MVLTVFRTLIVAIAFAISMLSQSNALTFTLASPEHVSSICIPPGEPECVRLAVDDLVSDVKRITGKELLKRDDGNVMVVSMNQPDSAALLERVAPGFGNGLKAKWEAYRVGMVGTRLIIAGSDERGTMFGIYHFIERYLGVDPLYFWASRPPQKRNSLAWEKIEISSDGPTFRFRGWFINDEDLLTEWMESGGKRNIDYPYYSEVVNPKAMRSIAEALVRSRCNLIIPASFVDIMNPPEEMLVKECARRGVFVSQHHVEPLGVSAFSYFNYWKARGKNLKYSYFSHPHEVREVWRAYAEKWAKYPNVIWQIGLRGIADRPMWMADENTPQSDADRGRLISEAMAEQVKILDEVCPRKPYHLTTTLWAEGSVLNEKGLLSIPKGTCIIFADNSPGWKWQQDFHTTPRKPENTYGVYYHHGLIGSGPHLAQVPSPHRTYSCLKTALEQDAGHYVIANVANIREFVLGIDATSKMTWRMDSFDPDVWLSEWVRTRFSKQQNEIADAYRIYFDAWQIHPQQKVPFLMDGQMFGAGNNALSAIEKMLKEGKTESNNKAKKMPQTKKVHGGKDDAFFKSLNDMHPSELHVRETLERLIAQKAGLSKAMLQAGSCVAVLPEHERKFLKDNLIYQSAIMIQTCEWLEHLLLAKEALSLGKSNVCVDELGSAAKSFERIPVLADEYCQGPWENWYRGCKKLNIHAILNKSHSVLKLARKSTKP